MSFREVTELRRAGRLDEALRIAREDYYNVAIDDFSASALFWTLRLVCEQSLANGDIDAAREQFQELSQVFQNVDDSDGIAGRCLAALELKVNPEYAKISSLFTEAKSGQVDDAMSYVRTINLDTLPTSLKESIGWICYYYIKYKVETLSEEEANSISNFYFSLATAKPSILHSQILNAYLRYAGVHQEFDLIGFIKQWGVDSFSRDDSVIDPSFPNARPLVDRALSRCFINRAVTLTNVQELFASCPYTEDSSASIALSRAYYSILYKDSAEAKNKTQFFNDAEEYVNRLAGVIVKNQYHSKILDSVLWEIDEQRLNWFKSFFEKWGLEKSFENEDWKSIVSDGHTLPSLAEKAIGRYGDAIESGTSTPVYSEEYKLLLEFAQRILPANENIPRRLAKIAYSEGRNDDAVKIMKNVIKTHPVKYYFWYELAQYLSHTDRKLCMSCCAKALLATNEEKYVGKIHLVMAQLFHEFGMEAEALCELERYRITNEANGWPLRPAYNKIRQSIPNDVQPTGNNTSKYSEIEGLADEFVYSDIPGHVMVLVEKAFEVNKDGKKRYMFYLYDDSNVRYRINPNAFGIDKRSSIMSSFEIKYLEEDDRKRIISVKPIPKVDVLKYKLGVLDHINKEKKIVHLTGRDFQLIVPVDRFLKSYALGESFYIAYCLRKGKDGKSYFQFIRAKRAEEVSDLIVPFEGVLSLKENAKGPFGFVDSVYIPRAFLKGLSDGDFVIGKGIKEPGEKIRLLSLSKKA